MLADTLSAVVILTCLACFAAVNLHNILIVHKRRIRSRTYAEVEGPSGTAVKIAGLGTLIYFLEAISYALLTLMGYFSLANMPTSLRSDLKPHVQVLGTILTAVGSGTFIWSVIARGVYATSWEMPENHKLITSGPYRYIRHPSYLGYFLMFLGLFAIWPNLFTVFPLIAIPGYYKVTAKEEMLLSKRFRTEYDDYKKRTGRFTPKLRRPD